MRDKSPLSPESRVPCLSSRGGQTETLPSLSDFQTLSGHPQGAPLRKIGMEEIDRDASKS